MKIAQARVALPNGHEQLGLIHKVRDEARGVSEYENEVKVGPLYKPETHREHSYGPAANPLMCIDAHVLSKTGSGTQITELVTDHRVVDYSNTNQKGAVDICLNVKKFLIWKCNVQ